MLISKARIAAVLAGLSGLLLAACNPADAEAIDYYVRGAIRNGDSSLTLPRVLKGAGQWEEVLAVCPNPDRSSFPEPFRTQLQEQDFSDQGSQWLVFREHGASHSIAQLSRTTYDFCTSGSHLAGQILHPGDEVRLEVSSDNPQKYVIKR